jgi:hypothetical protein
MVVFARDEPNLFGSLFHTRHNHPDIVDSIFASILANMKADPFLRLLPDASLGRLLHNLGMFTLGLAASIVYGRREDPSAANIIRQLYNAGNMMIYAEVAGIADADRRKAPAPAKLQQIMAIVQCGFPEGRAALRFIAGSTVLPGRGACALGRVLADVPGHDFEQLRRGERAPAVAFLRPSPLEGAPIIGVFGLV